MKKNLGTKISLFILSFMVLVSLASTTLNINKVEAANGSGGEPELYGLDEATPGDLKSSGGEGLPTMIGNIVGAALSFVGVLFLLLMIYGGILWMTARGNEQQVEKARNLIIAAVIGLVIVLGAYAITSFIGEQLTS